VETEPASTASFSLKKLDDGQKKIVSVTFSHALLSLSHSTHDNLALQALVWLHMIQFRMIRLVLNLLKPTGYVMHHQFNIQQLYALPTLYLCVLYLSENKQRLVPLTA